MSFLSRILKARTVVVTKVRTFMKAAMTGRLTEDWNPGTMTGDAALLGRIQLVRDRMRQQELDNSFARRYYDALENNVLGCEGLSLSIEARDRTGALDKPANDAVWEAFKEWGKIGNCTVSGCESWVDVQNLILRSAARDGGVLIRKRMGKNYGPHGFQLQLFEIDQLDVNYSGTSQEGNSVFMGIEKNDMGRVVAYHVLDRHPGDTIGFRVGPGYRKRIDASEIIHFAFVERITSSIGVPRLVSAAANLKQLGEYMFSESVASRVNSNKGGWFESDRGAKFQGETQYDDNGNPATLNDFEPGSFDELPAGTKFVPYDPKHPVDAFEAFVKTSLLESAAGGGVSYMTLTGDLSSANYSSMRAGRLEESEFYKKLQKRIIQHFAELVFGEWLLAALAMGVIPKYTVDDFDRLNKPCFRGRRWPWVDPMKDIQAAVLAIKNGLNSRTDVMEEAGKDIEDVFERLAAEEKLAEKYDIEISDTPEQPEMPEDSNSDSTEDDSEEDSDRSLRVK